jgi:hypothetical protein
MSKTPEEMAQQYVSTIADTHSVKAACEKAFIAGWKAGYGRGYYEGANTDWDLVMSQHYKQLGYEDENA